MISALHLLWIVPLSASVGFVFLSLFTANAPKDCTECEFCRNCDSWYGGTNCKHRDEIAKR